MKHDKMRKAIRPRTIYDARIAIENRVYSAAPTLYHALNDLLNAVEERNHLRESIESTTIAEAHRALDLAGKRPAAAIRDAGLTIVPVEPTGAMLQAGQQERDDNAHVSEIWGAMVKAAQEGTP